MKTTLKRCAAVGCLVAMAGPASAQLPITLNLGMGLWKNDGERELNDTETPYGGVEWAHKAAANELRANSAVFNLTTKGGAAGELLVVRAPCGW